MKLHIWMQSISTEEKNHLFLSWMWKNAGKSRNLHQNLKHVNFQRMGNCAVFCLEEYYTREESVLKEIDLAKGNLVDEAWEFLAIVFENEQSSAKYICKSKTIMQNGTRSDNVLCFQVIFESQT